MTYGEDISRSDEFIVNQNEATAISKDLGELCVSALESIQKAEEKKDNAEESASPCNSSNDADGSSSTENKNVLRKSSSSFMRAHDLGIPQGLQKGGVDVPSPTLHELMKSTVNRMKGPDLTAAQAMFFVDQDLKLVLDELVQLGYKEATDEGARFVPGRETMKILKQREQLLNPIDPDWLFPHWQAANPKNLDEVLIWNGTVDYHKGFGHDWPIIKARGIIPTSPRNLVDFLWNSANVPRYNKMSKGRDDVLIWQENVETTTTDSEYGFPGCAKVMKSFNKIKMVPRLIETLSILHARALEPPLASPGTYIMVNRSIWESDVSSFESGAPQASSINSDIANNKHKVIRSETYLGVQLLRPIRDGTACEMTTITHASAPGLNKTMAKAVANVSAAKIIRDIQASLV